MGYKSVSVIRGCEKVGTPLDFRIDFKGLGAFSPHSYLIAGDVTNSLRDIGYLVVRNQVNGEVDSKGNMKTYNPAPSTNPHEEVHVNVARRGLSRLRCTGYIVLEESMAYLLGDLVEDDTNTFNSRLAFGREAYFFYRKMLQSNDIQAYSANNQKKVNDLIKNSSFSNDRKNWAAFVKAVDCIGLYSFCYDLLDTAGIYKGQELFYNALEKAKENKSLTRALTYLTHKMGKTKDYLDLFESIKPTRRGGGISNRLFEVRNDKQTIRVTIWGHSNLDRKVIDIVRAHYEEHEEALKRKDRSVGIRTLAA